MARLILVLLLSPILLIGQTWNTQLVNPGEITSPRSITYDSNGYPYIIQKTPSGQFQVSYWNGTSWNARTHDVDPGDSKKSARIIRNDTTIYIAEYAQGYFDSYFYYNFYIEKFTGFGGFENLAYLNPIRTYFAPVDFSWAFALSSDSRILLAYTSFDVNRNPIGLSLRRFDISSGTWGLEEIIDGSAGAGRYCDIMQSNDGRIWISYQLSGTNDLKVARSIPSGGWDNWFVDTSGDVGSYSQIAVDGNGTAHITYYDATNRRLKYATFTP